MVQNESTAGNRPVPARTPGPANRLFALLAVVPAASIGAIAGLWIWPGVIGQTIFGISKLWLFAGPLVWLMLVDRRRPSVARPARQSLIAGVLIGLTFALAICGAYLLTHHRWIHPQTVIAMAHKNHLDMFWLYVAFALTESFGNSLMEEYVWRWFVVSKAELLVRRHPAMVLSALLFTLHHVIAMAAYFNWKVTVLASIGVFLGGMIWSAMYLRYRSIWPGYISHVMVDLAVFGLGAWIIFR